VGKSRYRDIKRSQVPNITLKNGVKIKVICGTVGEYSGPVKDVVIEPEYLDVTVPARAKFVHEIPMDHTAFAYVIEGQGSFDGQSKILIGNGTVCLYENGDHIAVGAGSDGVRFLLISGQPIGEPVAWYGPIVMNTQAELEQAFREYQNGTFVKHK
jgi:redox-sensitive bicupin YhaK (pirin superfamily)